MGLDATIKRRDGKPLGTIAEVQQALATVFPGVSLRQTASGADNLRNAANQGITIPDFLRQHIAAMLPKYEGCYEGANFSAEFYMPASEPVEEINVTLRGRTTDSEPIFALLDERFDWITTHL